ncbi:MAG: hypothetical protein AAGA48_21765, partial [Myxococcota bacterium]
PTCHRLEVHDESGKRVVTEGGGRRPVDADREAWPHLARAAQGDVKVVGTCPQCGQPLLTATPSDLPGAGYDITIGGVEVRLTPDQTLHGPYARLSVDQIQPFVQQTLRRRFELKPMRTLFQSAVLTMGITAPLTVFAAGLFGLSIFFWPILSNWRLAWKLAFDLWGFS